MSKLESDIEQADRDSAKANGWFVEKIQKTGRNGFPDRFYAKGGRVILIEWKKPGGRATPQQKRRHGELREAGVEVYVVDSIEHAKRIRGDV